MQRVRCSLFLIMKQHLIATIVYRIVVAESIAIDSLIVAMNNDSIQSTGFLIQLFVLCLSAFIYYCLRCSIIVQRVCYYTLMRTTRRSSASSFNRHRPLKNETFVYQAEKVERALRHHASTLYNDSKIEAKKKKERQDQRVSTNACATSRYRINENRLTLRTLSIFTVIRFCRCRPTF